jgi:NitT/TauT family transport system ATP-binding protein
MSASQFLKLRSAEPNMTSTASAIILQIANVTKQFVESGRTVDALCDVSIDVAKGEFISLFGPSGCGKSTLLNMIAGFDAPTTGSITLEGRPITKPGPDRLMMLQEHGLFPWLNVIDNVSFGLRNKYGYSRFKARRLAAALIKAVHLGGFERSPIHKLSGGMKQRVALARSLAPDPHLLLIDEPFAALDVPTKQHLYRELQEIFVQTKKTIISVTHDAIEAACLADRVIVMTPRPGKIKREIAVDLPRPRDPNSPEVLDLSRTIAAEL